MPKIDYLTVSIAKNKNKLYFSTADVLLDFAEILPDLYKQTSKEAKASSGTTKRISQYRHYCFKTIWNSK